MSILKLARTCLPLAGAVTLLAADARAVDYYVSPFGSDGATGTQSTPFRTISRAVAAAMPGDTVYIRGGTYVGWANQLNPIRAGRADAWITFRAYEGELPVLLPPSDATEASAFEPFDDPGDEFDDVPISFIRVEGLVAYQWPTSGFSNGWEKHANNIEVRHCIADGNGVNGLTFYEATGVVFEHNIAAHNGNRAPSYSSGVNLYRVQGGPGVNIVRGNVSFENIDICGNPAANGCSAGASTDGNGFILDEGGQGVRFESNLAFRNGGSCLRMTLTGGAQLINNTCYNNGLDTGYAFSFGEIFFSDQGSRNNIIVRNNIAVGTNGQPVINDGGGANADVANNAFAGTAAAVFRDPNGTNPDFRLSQVGQNLLNTGSTGASGPSGANDLGFDPRCIVRAPSPIQGVSFWQYAVNYSYIQSIGGVAACFRPAPRAVGAAPDMGAYEAPAAGSCQFHGECDDGDVCTRDRCGQGNQCSNDAIAGCCVADADCEDASACTTNTCNTGSNTCETRPVPACCSSAADCDDGNACTTDACGAAGNCSNTLTAACASEAGPIPPLVNVPVVDPGMDTGSQGPTPVTPAPGNGETPEPEPAAGAGGASIAPGAGMTGAAAGAPATLPPAAGTRGSDGGCALRTSRGTGSVPVLGALLGAAALLIRRRRLAASAALLALGCGGGDEGGAPATSVPDFGNPPDTMAPGAMPDPMAPASSPMDIPNTPAPNGGGNSETPAPAGIIPAEPVTPTMPEALPPDPINDPPSGPPQACAGTPAAEDGLLLDFGSYDMTTGAWGNDTRAELTGGTSAYSCITDSGCPAAAALGMSPTPAGSMRFSAELPPGGYNGVVLWFGPCVDASAFDGIQFVASGTLGGAELLLKVQTHANYPVDVANAKGACPYTRESAKWSECVPPAVVFDTLPVEPGLVVLPWSAFSGGLPSPGVSPDGLVGIELQFQCPSATRCVLDVALGTLLFERPPFAF